MTLRTPVQTRTNNVCRPFAANVVVVVVVDVHLLCLTLTTGSTCPSPLPLRPWPRVLCNKTINLRNPSYPKASSTPCDSFKSPPCHLLWLRHPRQHLLSPIVKIHHDQQASQLQSRLHPLNQNGTRCVRNCVKSQSTPTGGRSLLTLQKILATLRRSRTLTKECSKRTPTLSEPLVCSSCVNAFV